MRRMIAGAACAAVLQDLGVAALLHVEFTGAHQ